MNTEVNLWTYDHYHASTHGYYLEALMVFGSLTGRDLRSLGANECSAYELGLSQREVKALQQVALDQLLREGAVAPASRGPTSGGASTTAASRSVILRSIARAIFRCAPKPA